MKSPLKVPALVLTLSWALSAGVQANDVEEKIAGPGETYGEQLYENHCRVCHNSAAFERSNSKVHSRADLEYFVRRWSDHLKLGWDDAARTAVADHLDRLYYSFEPADQLH